MINEELFWSKVREVGVCWAWTGGLDRKGYGQLSGRVDGRRTTFRAHRVAYELVVGLIRPGLVLDHLCRNHWCVNPAHLEPVTHLENVRRGERATMTHCGRGHEFTAANTYTIRLADGLRRRCRTCNRDRSRRWRERKTNPTQ